MLARLCSKSFNVAAWTENFQMYKLGFKEAEEPEINLPTFVGSWRKQGNTRIKTSMSASLITLKPLTVGITANWKIPKEMEISDHLTCLLRNLFAGQEATVRAGHGTKDWFQIGKWAHQGCLLSPWLFNLYADCIMWNAKLDESQAGIKIAGSNTNTSDMQMTPF